MSRTYFPEGKKAAISLSFDDARLSQVDRGMPLFEKLGVRATFYVMPGGVEKRLDGWKKMLAFGHEVGNHTLMHPCTGNFPWSRTKALEDYTLDRMARELDDASAAIERLLGIKPRTFGYPCGQTFVGRGHDTRSYVPLVAERFIVGRGYQGEAWNDPAFCDLSQTVAFGSDGLSFEQMRDLVDGAIEQSAWVTLAGHEIADEGRQTTRISEIEKLCRYCQQRSADIWIGTIAEVGSAIRAARDA